MAWHRTCDGIGRRDFLAAGVLGAGSLTLPGFLKLVEAGETQSSQVESAIFINLQGGPSHIDTFDYKPDLYALGNLKIHLLAHVLDLADKLAGQSFAKQVVVELGVDGHYYAIVLADRHAFLRRANHFNMAPKDRMLFAINVDFKLIIDTLIHLFRCKFAD